MKSMRGGAVWIGPAGGELLGTDDAGVPVIATGDGAGPMVRLGWLNPDDVLGSGRLIDEVPGVPRAPRVTTPDRSSSQAGLGTYRHRLLLAPADTVAASDHR